MNRAKQAQLVNRFKFKWLYVLNYLRFIFVISLQPDLI